MTVLAPNSELVNRPMTVREPFAYPRASRYPLAPIVADAGAELISDELAWIEPDRRVVHTKGGAEIEYDALLLAIGARIHARYEHALTINDTTLDETLHGLLQDLEGGYIHSLAFIAPGRMAWPMPLYELALLTAGRAYDMNIDLATTIITPEDRPARDLRRGGEHGRRRAARARPDQGDHLGLRRGPAHGRGRHQPGRPPSQRGPRDRASRAVRPRDPRHPPRRTRLRARRSPRPGAGRRARLRGGGRDRLRREARRRGLAAGRRGRRVDRCPRGGARQAASRSTRSSTACC